ncbi:MAG: hypothetical protein JOY84_06955 [Curvibacter sp.]|nr:hypothetical protein [Curvibacter sp.]
MLLQIIQHTPIWVFGLFLALLWLGLKQTATRQVKFARLAAMALAMVALSLYGTLSAFASLPATVLLWALVAAAVAALVRLLPMDPQTEYDPERQLFTLPGSFQPLLMMMGIFATKYVVGASLAMHPELAGQADFAYGVGAVYGFFSGLFLGRTLRLWQLAQRTQASAREWVRSTPMA